MKDIAPHDADDIRRMALNKVRRLLGSSEKHTREIEVACIAEIKRIMRFADNPSLVEEIEVDQCLCRLVDMAHEWGHLPQFSNVWDAIASAEKRINPRTGFGPDGPFVYKHSRFGSHPVEPGK